MGDESERRTTEVEAELATLRRLFRLADVPILTLDARGRILSTNGLWFGGGAVPDCVGQPLWSLFDPADREALERGATRGWTEVSGLDRPLVDGRRVAVTATQLPGDGARAEERWVVALRDVSHRVELEGALDLQRKLGVLSDFAGAVARELIDPISIVQGRLELLLSLGVDDPQATERHLSVALEHARRLTTALRNLRLVGRSPVVDLQRVALQDVLSDVRDLLGPRQERIRTEVEGDSLAAGGDRSMYARVLATLVRASLEGAGRSPVVLQARPGRDAVDVSVGPVGRPRGDPDPSRTGLALEATLLRSVGGQLHAWRRGNDRHFLASLPLPPVAPRSKRPVEHALLLVGTQRFQEGVQQALDMDGFRFHGVGSAQEALDVLEGEPDVALVGIELIQPDLVSGMALAHSVVRRHPELAGSVLVAGQPRVVSRDDRIVGVSSPIRRQEWLQALRRRRR